MFSGQAEWGHEKDILEQIMADNCVLYCSLKVGV